MVMIITFLGAMIDIRVFLLEMRIPVVRCSERISNMPAVFGVTYQCRKSLHPI